MQSRYKKRNLRIVCIDNRAYDGILRPMLFSVFGKIFTQISYDLVDCDFSINESDETVLIIGPPFKYPTMKEHLRVIQNFKKKQQRIFLWWCERLPVDDSYKKDAFLTGYFEDFNLVAKSNFYERIFVLSKGEQVFLQERVSKYIEYLPIGYHESMEFNEAIPVSNDVGFIGWNVFRRKRILQNLQDSGVKIEHQIGWYEDFYKKLLSNKILLNIHASESNNFEMFRIIPAMANKIMVLSEPIASLEPFIDGQHLVVSETRNLDDEINRYLQNSSLREEIASNGYEFIKNSFRFEDHVKRISEYMI